LIGTTSLPTRLTAQSFDNTKQHPNLPNEILYMHKSNIIQSINTSIIRSAPGLSKPAALPIRQNGGKITAAEIS